MMGAWIFWMGPHWGAFRPQWGSWAFFLLFFWSPFWVDLGTRPGAQNRPKTRPLAENEVTGTGVLSIFQLFRFFPAFSLDVCPIFDEKSMFFPLLFSMRFRLFCNLATLTIIRVLQVQTRFFNFRIFPPKKCKNVRKQIDEKGEARKMTKNDYQGVPRIASSEC